MPKKTDSITKKTNKKKIQNKEKIQNKDKPIRTTVKMNVKTKTDKQHITTYNAEGVNYLDTLSESVLSKMVLAANKAYHTDGKPLMTDAQYDILREYISNKWPENLAIQQIGAPAKGRNKVRLPYHMPSMNKIKPDSKALASWKAKYTGPYVISVKLDGVSGMYDTTGAEPKLYTRGDGTIGQDISHLIKPLKLPNHTGVVVRGEFIMTKATFADKYADKFANARNLISGFVNSKTLDATVHDVQFVTYEVIVPELRPSTQFARLAELGHRVAHNQTIQSDVLTQEYLMDTLRDWKATSDYEMDGIIVSDDHVYKRTADNPEHGFAFKMVLEEQQTTTEVRDVLWMASQDGYLKPRVQLTPVRIGGVTIEYATGFNAKFIQENEIGPGAIVQLIRSGDVIPYIQSVVKPAPKGAKMPDLEFVWNATHVDIIVADVEADPVVKEKNIVGFFSDIEVENLSKGNVRRIMDAGFDTIPAIIHMSKADLESVEGFKEKMADKIYESIRVKLSEATLVKLMVASNKFGRGMGAKVIQPVIDAHPDFLTNTASTAQKIEWLNEAGIHKNAALFCEAIEPFIAFLKECGLESKLREPLQAKANPVDSSDPLFGKSVVMTKVRDASIIEHLTKVGGTLEDSFKPNCVGLIVKTKDDVTTKTQTAEKKGIPVYTVAEFKAKYHIV